MISFFSSASIIALVVATTTTTPCGCHQSFSSRDSRRSHHAFLCAKPKLTKQSLQLQHNVVTKFTVRRSKQADEGIPVLIDSESHDKERYSNTRRRWIRDMIVFGSNSIAARTYASTTTISSSSSDTKAAAICDPTIESYQKGSNKIHIIGTAHVSSVSAQLAGAAVKEIKPAAVFIELDPQRINRAFRNGRITQAVNIVFFAESKGQVTMRMAKLYPQDFEKKSNGLFQALEKMRVQNPIQEMYEGLEAQGITPGEEFVTAVEAGIQNNSIIILGDRPMDVTLKRIAKALIFDTDLKKLAEADEIITNKMKDRVPELQEWERQMNESGQQTKELSPEEFSIFVERLKTKETTMALMNEVKKAAPALYEALVGERDVFMGRAMDSTASALLPSLIPSGLRTMVSVVGLGHVEGIGRELISMGWSKFTPANCR
eukprot:scaffold11179_cov124-Skeletonema_marinoi.AAC.4